MRISLLILIPSLALAAEPTKTIPAFQGGGPLLGACPAIAPPPYKVRWKFKAGDEERRAAIESNPTIAGDTVYVSDANGGLHALDLATGKPRWAYSTDGGFATTPIVTQNKVLLGDLSGLFHCVAADTGKKIWTFESDSPIHASANLTPDGTAVIFGNDGAQIVALSVADGKKLWEAQGGDRINACPAIGFSSVMVTGCDARLLALDLKSGQNKFAADLGALAPGSPAVLTDRIIAATGEGTVLALSPDGKQTLWKYEQVDQQQAMFYASPSVADGVIVIGCRDRQVHAIDAKTGQRKWAFKTRGEVDATAAISDGRVYAASKDKKLYVLDLATGQKLWDFTTARSITAGPAIAGGVIVLGDTAGNVYCLEAQK